MAKLQVSRKVTDLVTCDVSKCLEDGVGKGPSWKHVSSNKFIYHWCVDVLGGGGHKHGQRDREYE